MDVGPEIDSVAREDDERDSCCIHFEIAEAGDDDGAQRFLTQCTAPPLRVLSTLGFDVAD